MRARVAAAAAGGVLYFLGYLGWGIWPCLLGFLVPLWWAVDASREPRDGAALGLVFGAAAYAGGFLWLWPLVDVFLGGRRVLGGVLWLAYGAWFAAGFALYGGLFAHLRRRGWPAVVAGAAPLVALEWLQPTLFPVNAGSGLARTPLAMQAADLGGPLLLTALVALGNVVGFETLRWARGARGAPRATWLAGVALLVAVVAYGTRRTAAIDAAVAEAPALRVGIVQANLGLMEKRTQAIVTHERHLAQTRELLAGGDVDLVVWPETAYVRGIRRPLPVSGGLVREDLRVPLLFGGSSVSEEGGRRTTANSAFLVGADGMIRDAYDKNLLVPIAEYLPVAGLLPGLADWFPHAQAFGASTETPALRLGAWRIATPICYEAARHDFVRRMMRQATPHLLVTLANDAWFGESQEPWIHLALARLRAVEHRRYVVRATNSGVSAVIDPVGRVVVASGLFTRENLRGTVHRLEGDTVYGRLGDWPGWLATLVALVGLGVKVGEGRRVAPAPRVEALAVPDA